MIRRYKRYTESTAEFWKAIEGQLTRAGLTRYAVSKKMGKAHTLLHAAQKQGVPLCPSSINLFCATVGATPVERTRLHTLAARGVGYEVSL